MIHFLFFLEGRDKSYNIPVLTQYQTFAFLHQEEVWTVEISQVKFLRFLEKGASLLQASDLK